MPARFPALLALMLNRRHYAAGELVYHSCDQSWNLFLVSSGTFANVGKPGVSGGSCPAMNGNNDDLIFTGTSLSTSMARFEYEPNPTLLTRLRTQVFKKEHDQRTPSNNSQRGFYPFQLFGQGRYFGDTELFENVERRSSVRCESLVGSLLVLHKRDLKRLVEDFPAFTPMWAVMSKHREIRRKELLRRLVLGQRLKNFAATTIQDFYRMHRASTIEPVESCTSLTSASVLQEPVARYPGTQARSLTQLPRPPVHLQSLPGSGNETVASLRADVDALRDEMRTGFSELQLCVQAAVGSHR